METRTYTERSNARRAARAAGLDPDRVVKPCDDGFEVCFGERNGSEHHQLKQAPDAATERGISPKQFVQFAAEGADSLDIPDALRRPAPTVEETALLNAKTRRVNSPHREIIMPKTKAKPAAAKGDKNATLLKMLSGKGSTVEQLTQALDWLPHTLRARISRLSKSKKDGGEGLNIERSRTDKVTTYRIAS